MHLIVPSVRRHAQPRQAAPIQWGHPLAKGLVFLAIPLGNTWVDLVGGQRVSSGSTARMRKPANGGVAATSLIGINAAGGQFTNQTGLDAIAGAFSLFVEGSLEVNTTDTSLVRSFESNNGRGFGLNIDDTNVVSNDFYAFVDNGNRGSSTVDALGANSEQFSHRIMITADGTNINLYARGVLDNSVGAANLPTADSNRRTTILGTNNAQGQGSASVVAGWNRALTLREYQQLYDNPWQLIRARNMLVTNVPSSAGSAALSGSSATGGGGTQLPSITVAL